MRKNDLTVPALLLEAVTIILVVLYIGLQIFYGVYYHSGVGALLLNLAAMILVYAAFTLLCIFPERVNRLPEEVCRGQIRVYTLRMLRLEKMIFAAGLLIPCIFDLLKVELPPASSLFLVGALLIVAIYYEGRIIQILRNKKE